MQNPLSSGSLRRDELVALVRADQHRQWRRGDPTLLESYLEQHPALRGDPEAMLQLVSNELLLREAHAEPAHLDDFLRRFPQHETPVRRVFELHQSLDAAPPDRVGLIDPSACSFLQPLATELSWGRSPAAAEALRSPTLPRRKPSPAQASTGKRRTRKVGNPLAGYPGTAALANASKGGLRQLRRKRKQARRGTITLLLSVHATLITLAIAAMEWLELRSDQPLLLRVLTALGGSALLLPLWYVLWRHRQSTHRPRQRDTSV